MNSKVKYIALVAGTALVVFGNLSTIIQPLGIPSGWKLFFYLVSITVFITIIYFIWRYIRGLKIIIANFERTNKSSCCVTNTSTMACPLGIKKIYHSTKETLLQTLNEPEKSFKWLGFSAFNVVHNNRDCFLRKKHVKFEFLMNNPGNKELNLELEKIYWDSKGQMKSEDLIRLSDKLLQDLKANVHNNIEIIHYNQVPTFRLVFSDNRKVYVSFYEDGKNALDTMQLEIEDSPESLNLYKWFDQYYSKTLLTERITKP